LDKLFSIIHPKARAPSPNANTLF